ncbi:MAG: ATP-binding protein, partial [Novipirellula sp. JB048]
ENDPSLIRPLVNLMQQVAAGMQLSDDVTRARIGMAIEQALLNAMCRGNLEIDREAQLEDEELQLSSEMTLVERRRCESPYGDRRVLFRAHLGHAELVFIVSDEGPGFDAATWMATNASETLEIEKGRGLVLIRSFMDEVRFNDAGNEIVMIKRFAAAEARGSAADASPG